MYCVILNASYEPLAMVNAYRGLVLCLDGRAELIEMSDTRVIRTVSTEYPYPIKIRLYKQRKTGTKYYLPAQFNQRNLFVRDDYCCQYCGRHAKKLKPKEYLTRDHVVPLARGGKDVWKNCVTACSTCNHKKDNTLLKDIIDMELLSKPAAPTTFEIMTARARKKLPRTRS